MKTGLISEAHALFRIHFTNAILKQEYISSVQNKSPHFIDPLSCVNILLDTVWKRLIKYNPVFKVFGLYWKKTT